MRREKVEEALNLYWDNQITSQELINGFCTDEPRKPVCSFVHTAVNLYPAVVCDDGSVWEFNAVNGWQQLDPIPGTRADLEVKKIELEEHE